MSSFDNDCNSFMSGLYDLIQESDLDIRFYSSGGDGCTISMTDIKTGKTKNAVHISNCGDVMCWDLI